jgi:outer membrane protein OmpA-like peptidoglycan-associated protein
MSRLALAPALLLALQAWAAPPKRAATPEINALGLLTGARVLDEDGGPWEAAARMLDGQPETQYDPGFSENAPLIIQLAEPFDVTRLEVINSNAEKDYPGISVKKLRVERSARHTGPWQRVVEWKLSKGTKPQSRAVSLRRVRYLRVTLVSNHGNESWIGLGELQGWGRRSASRKIQFTGAWETNYGELRLTQTGGRITGCYGPSGSKAGHNTVEGTLEGAVFFGRWREANEGGADTSGTMAFALTQEGELSGVWGTGPTDRTTRWDGTKLPRSTITCARPEEQLGEELKSKGRVVLHGILFDDGKDSIRPESITVLQALARAMKETPGVAYLIEGHTDDRGGEAPNQALSEKRAASVKKWLVDKGIPDKQLRTQGFGMGRPTMPNTSEAGRAANRRVEVVRAEQ